MGSWLVPVTRRDATRARIVGIAHCGAGASLFRGWARRLPPVFDLWAVQLPGREERAAEPCETSMTTVVDALLDGLERMPAFRTILFGHSLGALVGFELAKRLERAGHAPAALVVSACAAPQLQAARRRPLHGLDDEAFLGAVGDYGGLPDALLADPGMRAAILRPLRADFEMCDAYSYREAAPLRVPIVAFGGKEDRMVTRTDLEAWRAQTSARYTLTLLPGDHFYLQGAELFHRALARELSPFVAGTADERRIEDRAD